MSANKDDFKRIAIPGLSSLANVGGKMSATLQTAKEQCDCSTDQSIYSKTKNGWYTEIILSGTTYTNTYRMDHLGYLIGEWVKVGIHGVSPVALTQEPTAVLAYIVCTPSDGLNPSAH